MLRSPVLILPVFARRRGFNQRHLVPQRCPAGRQEVGEARGRYARGVSKLIEQGFLHLADPRPVFIPRRAHVEGHAVRRIEPQVHVRQIVIAAQHQTSARQQQNGKRHLRRNQHALPLVAASGSAAPRLRQHNRQIRTRRLQSRQQSAQHRCAHSCQRRESQRTPAHLEPAGRRQASEHAPHRLHQPHRHQSAQPNTQAGHQQDLAHHRAQYLRPRRADRPADRHLPFALLQLREHQPRDVRHRDQQQHGHCPEHKQQGRAVLPHAHFLEAADHRRPTLVGLRILFAKLVLHAGQIVMCLRQRYARLHAADAGIEACLPHAHQESRSLRGQPDVDAARLKTLRHHPHHGEPLTPQDQSLPDSRAGLAIAPRPKTVADDSGSRAALPLFIGSKQTPVNRRDAEDAEVSG